ncbi:MAG: glycoside hydrolase family 3 C-terminal domain-containing protein [Lachnospiraceae bacterium]|nr:glycoside hydrolase family 3 C-terminal domain-containing protein [Lachnospiraceae bacterium]
MEQYEKDHLDFVLENAGECTVLLKHDGNFPVKEIKTIAAFGSGVRYTVKGGTGSGEVNTRFSYTIEEGLEKEGVKITTKEWLDAYDGVRLSARKAFVKDVKAEARRLHTNPLTYALGKVMPEPENGLSASAEGDVCIYVVSRISGEGSDRTAAKGDALLNDSEIRDILKLNREHERFMLVLNVGGVVDLSPVMEVRNILLLSQLGVNNGRILLDILTGKQNPSGKLATTWAAWDEYSHEGSFGEWDETRYREGVYVGYRYFDTFRKKALFPFGYGDSYTSFEIKQDSVSANKDEITVVASVHNTGNHSGKEVVQVYVSKPSGKLDQPVKELAGFAKTGLLLQGASESFTVKFRLRELASYDEERQAYVLEAGDYIIRVGSSSSDTKIAAVVTLSEDAAVSKVKNVLGKPDFKDITCKKRAGEEIPAEVVKILLDPADIVCNSVSYERKEPIDERVRGLSDEEISYLLIGAFDPKGGLITSVIGESGTLVPGTAGETTSQLKAKGIMPLVMADGPAGLRLTKTYYEDKKGFHDLAGTTIPSTILDGLGPITRSVALKIVGPKEAPKGAVIKEQMATMIPIGTAIAQSFNYDLAKAFGDIVGAEMEHFGVHLWLAPALNIHRNILCGRNFEYYSEDPVVSGLMAAAITEGVQAHKGCAVTIKHYAANNAETNRYYNNSQVSERALREIYLRGFEIVVKKANPRTVMTSYNLLNGIHTSEHRGLIEDILRSEWGFKGLVMTDWVVAFMTRGRSIHRTALSNEVAAAGGDIFMPGSKADYKRVLKVLKNGTLSRKQTEINASRLLCLTDEILS